LLRRKMTSLLGASFPHAFSGNPDEIRTGPPIKTFGGDDLEKILIKVFLID
jgi:hypothetical protein